MTIALKRRRCARVSAGARRSVETYRGRGGRGGFAPVNIPHGTTASRVNPRSDHVSPPPTPFGRPWKHVGP